MMTTARRSRRPLLRWTPLLMIAAVGMGTAALTSPTSGPLIVHEWGTFVSMEGSDGLVLEGLHHDEADLPGFVHSRPRDQLRLHATTSKLETPVIYFYTDGTVLPEYVNVHVDFPEGIITQWYPQASLSSPRLLQGDVFPPLKGGSMEWGGRLVPDTRTDLSQPIVAAVPRTGPKDVWNFARATRSAFFVMDGWDWATSRAVNEREKFIFYRGLGRFDPSLRLETESDGRVALVNTGAEPISHLFVLRIEGGRAAFEYLPNLAPGREAHIQVRLGENALPVDPFVDKIAAALAARLVESGLFPEEAQAMVNTWNRSYFRTPGMRVLYLVPRGQIDRTLPIQVRAYRHNGNSMTTKIERVFVGRVECLTPEQEARIEGWLRDLASTDPDRAAAARGGLLALGRFAEPHLRRALQNSSSPAVRATAQRLLASDALDELVRAEREFPTRTEITARLAALQRRAGLVAEARRRGEAAVTDLQATLPTQNDHVQRRKWFRAMAFAREAIGDPGPAADAYLDWVRFAAGVKNRDCQTCHKDVRVKPLTYADLRGWWGGERFREMAAAAGKTEAFIAAAQQKLQASPNDPEALVTLGYLLPTRGDTQAVDRVWAKLAGNATSP
jgi:hypothetical protein